MNISRRKDVYNMTDVMKNQKKGRSIFTKKDKSEKKERVRCPSNTASVPLSNDVRPSSAALE